MFTNIAYDAYFIYLGLSLHEKLVQIITSEAFFRGLALIIFGVVFFIAVFRYFAQFSNSTFFARNSFPLTKIFKVIFVFGIGISLLKVDSNIGVQNYERTSWHSNDYVSKKLGIAKSEYNVSFIFDLLMRTAQETGAFATFLVEKMFPSVHSQTKEPFFFYRAAMLAGATQIEDQTLRDYVSFFTEECAEKALSTFKTTSRSIKERVIDNIFGKDRRVGKVNEILQNIDLGNYGGVQSNCLAVKEEMQQRLHAYINSKATKLNHSIQLAGLNISGVNVQDTFTHMSASSALMHHFLEEKDGLLGIEKGAQLPGSLGKVYQHLSRITQFEGVTSALDPRVGNPALGAAEAAKRANEFNGILMRAPVIRGVATMFLIAIFPILFFWVIAMRWRVLIFWFSQMIGICLWPAVWALIYSIMTNVALSVETLSEYGRLNDGIALTSASIINQKMYFYFSIMNWLMIASAAAINGGLFWMQRTVVEATHSEAAPSPIREVGNAVKNGATTAAVGSTIGAL